MAVGQLELAILQLTQQIDELLTAAQNILQGKLPTALINPTILHNILRNVSLTLPENYELAAGTKQENVHLYYDLVKVSMLGSANGVNMLMAITLKTASKHFTLHKLIVLPTRVSENKFIEYVHDFAYMALSFNQRDFALLKQADLQICSAGILTVCPINVPLYDAKVPACEAELFFPI